MAIARAQKIGAIGRIKTNTPYGAAIDEDARI